MNDIGEKSGAVDVLMFLGDSKELFRSPIPKILAEVLQSVMEDEDPKRWIKKPEKKYLLRVRSVEKSFYMLVS